MEKHNLQLIPYLQGFYLNGTVFIGMEHENNIAILLIPNFRHALQFTKIFPTIINVTAQKIKNYFDKPLFETYDVYEATLDDADFIMPKSTNNNNETEISNSNNNEQNSTEAPQIAKITSAILKDIESLDALPKFAPQNKRASFKNFFVKYLYQSDIRYKQYTQGSKVSTKFWVNMQFKSMNDNKIKLFWYDVPKVLKKYLPIPQDSYAILYNIKISKEDKFKNNSYMKDVNQNDRNINGYDFMMLALEKKTLIIWNFHNDLSKFIHKLNANMIDDNLHYMNC